MYDYIIKYVSKLFHASSVTLSYIDFCFLTIIVHPALSMYAEMSRVTIVCPRSLPVATDA